MIKIEDALKIHSILIEKFGGTKGIRDKGALESAISRPYATFDNKELYATPIDKAAAYLKALCVTTLFYTVIKEPGMCLPDYCY